MLGSMFALRETLMEGASFYNNDVTPFNFMNEDTCFNEANTIIAETMNDITSFSYEGQSLIVENMSNPRIDILTEGFFASFGEKIKKFFENMKKLFIGIYDRMRAYAAKLTGNTAKWLQIMTPRIKAKKTATGIDELEVTIYKGDIGSISDNSANTVIGKYEKLYKTCKDEGDVAVNKNNLGSDIDKEKIVEDELKSAIKNIADEFGISSTADTVDDFISDFNDALFGDTEDLKVASNADSFLEMIKHSTKYVNDTTKDYKKVIDAVDKCRKNMESMASSLKTKDKNPNISFKKEGRGKSERDTYIHSNNNIKGRSEEDSQALNDEYKVLRTRLAATFEAYATVCSKVSSLFNSAKNLEVKYIKSTTNTLMNALTKMAYFKEKKSA